MCAVTDGDGNQGAKFGDSSEVAKNVVVDEAGTIPNPYSVAEVLKDVVLDHKGPIHTRMGIHRAELIGRLAVASHAIADEFPVSFADAELVDVFSKPFGAAPVQSAIGG